MKQIRLLVIDEHPLLRKGLKNLIENEQRFRVVAEADCPTSAMNAVEKHKPDIVITNSKLPSLSDAVATIQQIVLNCPSVRVLVVSDDVSWKSVKTMLEAGAKGYLSNRCDLPILVSSILRVVEGHVSIDAEISSLIVLNCFQSKVSEENRSEKLTDRELEVLAMTTAGKSAKDIAYDLGLNCRTIAQHRQNIMRKLDLYSVADLTKYAIKKGLTTL